MTKNKLTKAQEKRFDEKFNTEVFFDCPDDFEIDLEAVKQHLADELALQKKKIIDKLKRRRDEVFKSEVDEAIITLK